MKTLRPMVSLLFSLSLIGVLYLLALPEANWWYARVQVEQTLNAHPLLQRNLLMTDALASEWEQTVGGAVHVRPLTMASELARQTGVWDSTLLILDRANPGTGLTLRLLDRVATDLIDYQQRLVQLSGLDRAAQATSAFLETPDRATLLALHQHYAAHLPAMREFHGQLTEWAPVMTAVDSDANGLNQALAALAHDPNPLSQAAAILFNPVVQPVAAHIKELSFRINDHAGLLPTDIATMQAVVDAVAQAETWEQQLLPAPLNDIAAQAHANPFVIVTILGVLAAANVVVRRQRKVSP